MDNNVRGFETGFTKMIDDNAFIKLGGCKEVVEEVLRIVLFDDELTVLNTSPRWASNQYGRRAVVDVDCRHGSGEEIEVEMHTEEAVLTAEELIEKASLFDNQSLERAIKKNNGSCKGLKRRVFVFLTDFDPFNNGCICNETTCIRAMEEGDGLVPVRSTYFFLCLNKK